MARARIVEAQRKLNGKFTVEELQRHLAAYIGCDPRSVRLVSPDFRFADQDKLTLGQLRFQWDSHNNEAQLGEESYYGKTLSNSPNNWRE